MTIRRALALACSGLALGAVGASADAGGGAEAGDPAVAEQRGATPAPQPVADKPSRSAVRAAQRRLRLEVDGIFGARTSAAVRRFQRRRGLPADGQLDRQTLAALGVTGRAARVQAIAAPSAKAERLLAGIAECESGSDPTRVSANGQHRGKYQFLTSTWESMGGTGDPAAAPEAEQDQRAAALLAAQGTSPWPVCGPRAAGA